jgi:hypothetical protein
MPLRGSELASKRQPGSSRLWQHSLQPPASWCLALGPGREVPGRRRVSLADNLPRWARTAECRNASGRRRRGRARRSGTHAAEGSERRCPDGAKTTGDHRSRREASARLPTPSEKRSPTGDFGQSEGPRKKPAAPPLCRARPFVLGLSSSGMCSTDHLGCKRFPGTGSGETDECQRAGYLA